MNHRSMLACASALALTAGVVFAAPTVGPGKNAVQETDGVQEPGRFFRHDGIQSVVYGQCRCDVGYTPCTGTGGKCTLGQVGKACSRNEDCSIWASVMDTGFEAPEWDYNSIAGVCDPGTLRCTAPPGIVYGGGCTTNADCDVIWSICGDEFSRGSVCNYPVSNVCISKHHAASQNCCPDDPNEETGWTMSPSSRHCSQPAIDIRHPSAGLQHMSFSYDPRGGLPAGCNGFSSSCRERAITSQMPVPELSRTLYSYDIAFDGTLGMSMINWMGQDNNQGSIYLNTFMYWYYLGGLYIYDFSASTFVFGGYWADTIPDYANFLADLDPCNNVVSYTYNGVLVHTEEYGFTPPYGDGAIDGFGSRKQTTDSGFFTTDHYPPVRIDIDEHRVSHTPCSHACCNGDTGVCTDGVAAADCAGPEHHYYPNMPCSFLGTAGYPPACSLDTGSCCDTSPGAGGSDAGGSCTSGVMAADCPAGTQQFWTRGGSCTDVAGSCHFGTGSCGGPAFGCANWPNVGRQCDTDADCDAQGFCEAGALGDLCLTDDDCDIPATVCLETTGSCCNTLDGTCTVNRVQAVCLDENPAQRIWLKAGDCSACSAVTGACCDHDPFGGCTDTVQAGCTCPSCVWTKLGSCATIECVHNSIPTVSEWGIVVLTLLLLIGAKVYTSHAARN